MLSSVSTVGVSQSCCKQEWLLSTVVLYCVLEQQGASQDSPNTRGCKIASKNFCNVIPSSLTFSVEERKEEQAFVLSVPFDTARHAGIAELIDLTSFAMRFLLAYRDIEFDV